MKRMLGLVGFELKIPHPSKRRYKRVRRITEKHSFTENHQKPPKTTKKIILIGELYPPSICFLVVYVYI